MAVTFGTVRYLQVGRSIAKVTVLATETRLSTPPGGTPDTMSWTVMEGLDNDFLLYDDAGVDMIDPTEMVKRSWMLGLLQRALSEHLLVAINHDDESALVKLVQIAATE